MGVLGERICVNTQQIAINKFPISGNCCKRSTSVERICRQRHA